MESLLINDDEFIKKQIEHDKRKMDYYNYVEKANLDNYDKEFVSFYRDGLIIVEGQECKISDLFLEKGLTNEQSILYLIYYKSPNNDVLSKKEKKDFKRTSVMSFRNTFVFYQIYSKYKNEIVENKLIINEKNINDIYNMVQKFDGTVHLETPETSYNKVKPRDNKE